jgi:hypothetical protein
MLAATLEGFTQLGATEGARRKMNIELGTMLAAEDPDQTAGQTEADQWYSKMKLVDGRKTA